MGQKVVSDLFLQSKQEEAKYKFLVFLLKLTGIKLTH